MDNEQQMVQNRTAVFKGTALLKYLLTVSMMASLLRIKPSTARAQVHSVINLVASYNSMWSKSL